MRSVIEPVLLAEVTLPEGHPRGGATCPVFGFVVFHAAGPILFDTGMGEGSEVVDALYSPVLRPLESALGEVGVSPRDVMMVINSHLHVDHCGNNRRFPGVPLVVQQAERRLAARSGYTVGDWVEFPGACWEPVEGEVEVLEGVSVFPTPGHTPGHQSVAVAGRDELEVIAAQAVYDPDELDGERSKEPLPAEEARATASSARRIKARRPDRVHFSHDPRVWEGDGS